MGTFAIGDVVLIPFPYADFSHFKKRPALIVGQAEFNNVILCQITSKAASSKRAIVLKDIDFKKGGLRIDSFVRPDKLFTVEQSIVESAVGSLNSSKLDEARRAVRAIFG